LGVGHEAVSLIPAKMIMLRRPKKDAKIKKLINNKVKK